jgi:hypothetical protein
MALFGRPNERDDRRARDWRDWLRRRNSLAIASFVLGCLSLTHLGILIVDAVASIVLGAVALQQLHRATARSGLEVAVASTGESPCPESIVATETDSAEDAPAAPKAQGHGLAWAGITLGGVSLAAALVIYLAPWRY